MLNNQGQLTPDKNSTQEIKKQIVPSLIKRIIRLLPLVVLGVAIFFLIKYILHLVIPGYILFQADKAFQAKEGGKAILLYEQVIKNYSYFLEKDPDVYYRLGISYLTQNKPYKASASFSKFLESNPPEKKLTAQVRYLMGLTFNDTEKYYQALQQLEKVPYSESELKIEPSQYHITLAESYFGKKKFDKALIAANKTLETADNKSSPQVRKAHLIKYLIFLEEGKDIEAEKEIVAIGKISIKNTDILSVFEASFYLEYLFDLAQSRNILKEIEYGLQISPDLNNFQKALVYTLLGSFYSHQEDSKQAYEYLQKAIDTDPDYLPAYYAIASFFNTQKDYQKALEYDQKAMQIDESDPLVRNGIGWSTYNLAIENNYNQEQLKIAEGHFKKAISLDPEFAIGHNNLGVVYLALEEYQEALSSFQTAMSLDPKYKKPYLNIGSTYLAQKKYDKVLEYYQQALEIDPNYALAYYAIADFYFRQKKYNEAVISLQKSQKLDPNYLDTYKQLAEVFIEQGQSQKAIDELNKGLKVKEDGGFYIALANIYRDLGETKKADELFAKGLSLQPTSSAAYQYNIGSQLKREGKFKEAKEQLIKALALDPKNTSTYITFAQVEEELGNLDESIKLLKQAQTIEVDNIDIYDSLGTAYSKKRDYQAAVATYKKALALDLKVQHPADVGRVYENLGLVYQNGTKQFDLAEEAFKNALKYDPKQVTIYINLGETYREKGMLKEAATQQRMALQFEPNNALAHNNLGYYLALQGNISDAIVEFKKALEIDPNLKIAKENLAIYQKKE